MVRTYRYNKGHNEIHEGESFTVTVVDTTMAGGETIIIAFKTPNTAKKPNLLIDWGAKVAGHLDIIEAPTWTNQTGTLQSIINRNRDSVVTSGLLQDQAGAAFAASSQVNLNPTGLAGGTVIESTYAYVATRESTQRRGRQEFILAQDTQYAIRFTADGGSNAGIVKLDWYEHTE